MENAFIEQYNKVFDKNGKIKLCGRINCKKLIEIADTLEPCVKHGNLETYMLNVETLEALKYKITGEAKI